MAKVGDKVLTPTLAYGIVTNRFHVGTVGKWMIDITLEGMSFVAAGSMPGEHHTFYENEVIVVQEAENA